MNSRLLHAAARGARIQYLWHPSYDQSSPQWIGTETIPISETDLEYRVHPSDEHLAYGPVSTATRNSASEYEFELKCACFPRISVWGAIAAGLDDRWDSTWADQTEFERSLALLIMAEALADEGL